MDKQQIDDIALRNMTLKVDDPRMQDGIVLYLPSDAVLEEILNVYHYTGYPKEKMYCSKCEAHRHAHGFTARLSNGQKVLLGSKCGADVFGTSWTEQELVFKHKEDRQSNLYSLDRLKEPLEGLESVVYPVIEILVNYNKMKLQVFTKMSSLYDRLKESASDDGMLRYTKKTTVIKEGSSSETDLKYVDYEYGKIDGYEALKNNYYDAKKLGDSVLEGARHIRKISNNTELYSTKTISVARRKFYDQVSSLINKIKDYHREAAFFEIGNFKKICEWNDTHRISTEVAELEDNTLYVNQDRAFVYKGSVPNIRQGYSDFLERVLETRLSNEKVKESRERKVRMSRMRRKNIA